LRGRSDVPTPTEVAGNAAMIAKIDTPACSLRPEVHADVSNLAIMKWPAGGEPSQPVPLPLPIPHRYQAQWVDTLRHLDVALTLSCVDPSDWVLAVVDAGAGVALDGHRVQRSRWRTRREIL